MIAELSGKSYDTIIYRDNFIPDTLKCINVDTKWVSLDGCIYDKVFTGGIECRDSLIVVEHVVPRKFLFFKWGCKEKRVDVVSRNPNNRILCVDYILKK